MLNIKKILTVVAMIAAMAATCFGAATYWDDGGVDTLWSNPSNWDLDPTDPGPLPGAIKTALGERNYGNAALNAVTLDSVATCLNSFEVYGKAVLTIVAGGSLTVDGGDKGIYLNGDDAGSAIVLAGGSLTVIGGAAGFFNLDIAMFGEGGGTLDSGTGINIDNSVGGQTTYTSTASTGTLIMFE